MRRLIWDCLRTCIAGHYSAARGAADGPQVNLNSRRCEEDGCGKTANYGYVGGSKLRCGEHRLKDMVRVHRSKGNNTVMPEL